MGSKHLMAAVADELSQQQRWLAHYEVAEKRHARRVMVQGVLHRLDLARRALMRVLRRLALLFLRMARSVATFVSATAVALFTAMHGAATRLRRLAPSARLCSRASPAQVARGVLGVERRAVARPRRHARAMGFRGLGLDERARGDAGAGIGQGRLDRIGVARSHIARAGHRALAWPRQNFATDQGAVANSRAQCPSRRPHRLGMDRRHFACARHHAAAMVRRGLDMDSPGGPHPRARFAQGNAAGIVMERSQRAHGRGRAPAQCFRRRRLVGSKCQGREPRHSRRSFGELFLGRAAPLGRLARRPACHAAGRGRPSRPGDQALHGAGLRRTEARAPADDPRLLSFARRARRQIFALCRIMRA